MSSFPKLDGFFPAPHTPMHPDGSLWIERIPAYADWLAEMNVQGVFVGGSTGESMSLSTQERIAIAEAWKQASQGRFKVLIHVGHTALPDCMAMAQHAANIGADGIGAMGPCYFKPSNPQDLAAFCAPIAQAAPSLPFYYYHIPSMTGVTVRMTDFLHVAEGSIPTFAGVKFTGDDAMDYANCLNYGNGKHTVFWGKDETMLTGLGLGGSAFIGSSYNYMAPLYQHMVEAFNKGDLAGARDGQAESRAVVELLLKYGVTAASKAILGLSGMEVGPVRLPLRALSSNEVEAIEGELRSIGFFEWRSGT